MGKRNKKSSHTVEDCKKQKLHQDDTTTQQENTVNIKVKKSKDKKTVLDPVEVVETKSRKINKKREKKLVVDTSPQTDDLDVEVQEENIVEKKVKKSKDRTNKVLDLDNVVETKRRKGNRKPQKVDLGVVAHADEKVKKSKKTNFKDDVAQQVASNSGQTVVTSNNKTQHKQNVLKDEDIKDEDIDEFCDELSPDDNVQFENWVKLIEAKLR